MNRKFLIGSLVFAALVAGAGANAMDYPMVGGSAMYPSRNIIENAMNSQDRPTLFLAVKAGGLVQTLEGPGRFRGSRRPMKLSQLFRPAPSTRC